MILAIIRESRKLYFLSFFTMGILSIITMKSGSELAPCLMFFIAMLYSQKEKSLYISICFITSGFILNYFFTEYPDPFTLPSAIVGNVGILLYLYFAVIRQPAKIDYLSKVTPLDRRQLLILKYLSRGVSRKEMPDKVSEKELWKYDIYKFSTDIINSEISKMKKILNITSEFELGIWYSKRTEIHGFDSKS